MSQIDISAKFHKSDKYIVPKEKISRQWYTGHPQRYSGDVFLNNIHGNGFYFIERDEKLFYDGLFYANKLEGYSQIFYGDGSHFQGLFKDHRRLGPGVLTYPNGEQDVGLWNGFSLARLEVVVQPNMIPRLGSTPTGKAKLVKYRYLVPVCPNVEDLAEDVLKNLEANDKVLGEAHQLYNLEVENRNNLFFEKIMFDKKFYSAQDCMIDILMPEEDKEEQIYASLEDDEEKPCKGSPTDLRRIRQISDELELIELKLENIRTNKYVIAKKVEYCKFCCYGVQGEHETSSLYETILEHEPATEFEPSDIEDKSTADFTTINYEKYEEDKIPESIKADSVFKIEDYLIDTCDCREEMEFDDLASLEKQLEAIKKDEKFYETIKGYLQEKLKIHLRNSEFCTTVKTQQVIVNDLLAWNNEELSMAILKHSFLHRRSEYMVTFSVSSLLKGERRDFAKPGVHEADCIDFLESCAKGEVKNVLDGLGKNKVNVNLSDARGNSAIFFAAANGQSDVVPILVNFGAKLVQLNDEGLTPLSLCFLIYLSLQYERYDWENSFLPESNPPLDAQKDLPKWYPDKSFLSVSNDDQTIKRISQGDVDYNIPSGNKLLGDRTQNTNEHDAIKEVYLFDTSFKVYKEPKKSKGKAKDKAKASKKMLEVSEEPAPTPEIQLKEKRKLSAEGIIKTLLYYGADPNVGEVPFHPLILAVFSENENLVKSVLSSNADTNIMIDDSMTVLHIVASLRCVKENIDICRVLLEADCKPNLKTSTTHWPEQKIIVLGKNRKAEEYEDFGKTPLHILCLRRDFPTDTCHYFESLTTMLANNEITPNHMYLGHTALSLAVISGNTNVVQTLLKIRPLPINPHQVLEYDMGNVLTLLILKRYENILPIEKCKDMLKLLVDWNVNPLNAIDDFENAIEFIEKEHEVIKADKGKGKGKGKKDKKDVKSKSSKESTKSSKKGPKKGKKGKVPPYEILKEYLKELARDTIIRYVQLEATEHLYNLVEANTIKYDFAKVLAEFLTPPVALENLTVLFNRGRIKYARFNKDVCVELLEFVEKHQLVVKTKKGKKDKKGKKGKKDRDKGKKGKKGKGSVKSSTSQESAAPPPPPTFSELIDRVDFTKSHKDKSKIKLKRPGLDDTTKYVVCFHCLRRADRLLLLCPRCQYVYYCSEQCNKQNVKMKGQHMCNVNFYKLQKQRLESGDHLVDENLHELCKLASITCEEMLLRRQEKQRELERRLSEEEKRLDIYGTRFLKKRQAPGKIHLEVDSPSVATSVFSSVSPTFVISPPLGQRLTRMSLRDDRYIDMMNRRHESSVRELDHERREEKKAINKKGPKKRQPCKCIADAFVEKEEPLVKQAKSADTGKAQKTTASPKFSDKEVVAEPAQIIRKLRKIPRKYQYFIELLSTYFPDVDLSFLFLPYACYCNGQLYYKFLDENIFSKTYSTM